MVKCCQCSDRAVYGNIYKTPTHCRPHGLFKYIRNIFGAVNISKVFNITYTYAETTPRTNINK